MKLSQGILTLSVVAALAACGDDELILQGDRIAPRDVLAGVAEPAEVAAPQARPISLPPPQTNADWTHRGGGASHTIAHPALGAATTRLWSANVGKGSGRKHRISADPVLGAGRIYTLDSRAQVAATGLNGAALWSADLTPATDKADDASGGGLSFAGGRVYVTTGFGELVALDAASGAVIWRQDFAVPVGGAPTVLGDTVYVAARDGSAWGIAAADGKVQWTLPGVPTLAGVTGVSAPAADDRIAVFPFASGDLLAVQRADGAPVWKARVAGERMGRAYAGVSDLTGDPVISGGVVYAGSAAGRLVAVRADTGERLWAATEGAASPVQVAGGSVFLISDEARLMRLDAATGAEVWAADMPYFVKDKIKKQKAIHANYGPVLAGGRLIVASSDGLLRSFDPASGALLAQVDIPGGAASAPVVAGGTVYVLGRNGQLHAFR